MHSISLVPLTAASSGPVLAPFTEEDSVASVTGPSHCSSGSGAQASVRLKPLLLTTASPLQSSPPEIHQRQALGSNHHLSHAGDPGLSGMHGVFQPSASRGPKAPPQVPCLISSALRQNKVLGKNVGSEARGLGANPVCLTSSCVALGGTPKLPVLQFPLLQDGKDDCNSFN